MSIMQRCTRHDPVRDAQGARALERARHLVERGARGHDVVDHGDDCADKVALAAEGAAHVALTLVIWQLDLRRRIACALAERKLETLASHMARDLQRLVVTAQA